MTSETPKSEGLAQVLRPLRGGFLQVGVFSMFINMMMLIPPLYMLQVYDRVLTSRSEETLLMLTLVLVWMFATLGVLEFVRSRIMVRMGNRLDHGLNRRLHNTVMRLALQQPNQSSSQPLADLASLRQFLSGNGTFAFFDTPWMPVYLGMLFLFDTALGMLGLCAVIVLVGLAVLNELSTNSLQSEAAEGLSKASRTVDAQLRNAEVLQAMGMQNELQKRWFNAHAGALKAHSEAADRAGFWTNLGKTLRLLFQSLMLGLGAYLAIDSQITPGMVIAASIILGRALAPIDQLIGNWKGFIGARNAYRRLDRLLQEDAAAQRRTSLPRFRGQLEVERAVLVPPGSETPSLKGVTFSVQPGETLAILGSSAAGKTSLVRAILGIWPLYAGHARLDGADLDQWNRDELGPRIGYLPQDVELFDGTIAENIARFRECESRQVIRAARIAGIDQMIRSLPNGYDTQIGAGGMALSGGQRQRIGLARAVFGRPKLVVLDEPNANLDQAGEKALSKACRYLKEKGVGIILVSHRQHILRHVDKILVLEAGQQQLFGPREAVLDHLAQHMPSLRLVRPARRVQAVTK